MTREKLTPQADALEDNTCKKKRNFPKLFWGRSRVNLLYLFSGGNFAVIRLKQLPLGYVFHVWKFEVRPRIFKRALVSQGRLAF